MSAWRCILFLAAASLLSPANAERVRLVTVEYPPYYGPDLPNDGPITEIVAEAYARVGFALEVEFMPWVRALRDAKAGRVDGVLGGWHSEERERWFLFSEPLPGNEIVLYKRKGTPPQTFTGYESLRDYKIGTVRGYRNPPEFDAANLRTEAADSDKVNLIKLANARVDLVLIDRAMAKFILATELSRHDAALEAVEPPLDFPPLYVLISMQAGEHRKKLDALNEGLKLLQAEGAVREIMKRHGM